MQIRLALDGIRFQNDVIQFPYYGKTRFSANRLVGACCERNLNNSLQNPTSEHGSYRQKTLMELYTSCIHVHDTMSVHNRERAKQMR